MEILSLKKYGWKCVLGAEAAYGICLIGGFLPIRSVRGIELHHSFFETLPGFFSKKALKKFKIESKLKKRIRKDKIIYRLGVFGLGNIKKFHNKIGFLHPNKKLKLIEVLNSYNEKVL